MLINPNNAASRSLFAFHQPVRSNNSSFTGSTRVSSVATSVNRLIFISRLTNIW